MNCFSTIKGGLGAYPVIFPCFSLSLSLSQKYSSGLMGKSSCWFSNSLLLTQYLPLSLSSDLLENLTLPSRIRSDTVPGEFPGPPAERKLHPHLAFCTCSFTTRIKISYQPPPRCYLTQGLDHCAWYITKDWRKICSIWYDFVYHSTDICNLNMV